jgi:Alginate lyase
LRAVETADARMKAALKRWGDRHLDRVSTARAAIKVEGGIAGRGDYDVSVEAQRDLVAIRDLALAARGVGPVYGEKAAALIARWLELYRPSFNPIDETIFENLFAAWDLLPDAAREPLAPGMAKLARDFAQGYIERFPTLRGNTAINNWHSHRVKIAALAAFETGDPASIAGMCEAYAAHLARTLLPEGPSVDFAERDAIHYVVYNALPLLVACLAARAHGEDWFAFVTPSGASLARTLAWIEPYANGDKTHAEFENSKVRFDFERRRAGVKGFEGNFDPAKARDLYALAARLDQRHWPLARKLGPTPLWYDAPYPRPA